MIVCMKPLFKGETFSPEMVTFEKPNEHSLGPNLQARLT